MDGPIVIGYDGSANAKDAIAAVADLFPGRRALVVHVWEPLSAVASVPPVPGLEGVLRKGLEEMDDVGAETSAKVAEEGGALAREAGLEAEPVTVRGEGRAWRGILALARDRDATAIAVGRRGVSGIEQAILGSVSSAVLRNADRPVLVAPARQ